MTKSIAKLVQKLYENNIDFQHTFDEYVAQSDIVQLQSFVADSIRSLQDKGFQFKFHYPNGIVKFLEDITLKEKAITPIIAVAGEEKNFEIQLAFCYTHDYSEKLLAFTNGIENPEYGMHVTGFRSAITKQVNACAQRKNIFKKDEKFSYDDIKEGLRCVLSIKMVDAQFTSQSKVKLGSTIARTNTEKIVSSQLEIYFEENPDIISQIITKAQLALKARNAARAARESVIRKGTLESTSLPGKLADCSSKKPEECELFVVEGDSAGGSAKQGRDREFQAILPLRGKVLNTEKATLDRIMNYEGLKNLIIAIGTGIGDKFDIEKIRYHKIILMTDADVDGAHISALLLTFLYRYCPQLIEAGYIYMARPPLYKISIGKKFAYVYSDEEKVAYLLSQGYGADSIEDQPPFDEPVPQEDGALSNEEGLEVQSSVPQSTKKKTVMIQRYKGLGEMNPGQLWETTMDPKTRYLYQVTVGDAEQANEVFEQLMGADVEPRKRFIEENALFVKELDLV